MSVEDWAEIRRLLEPAATLIGPDHRRVIIAVVSRASRTPA